MPRKQAGLKVGGFIDYASPARILKAFGNDMAEIRKEYSRQRSIIRKRVERMAEAGMTRNATFERFGDVKTQLPTVKSLSDRQLLEMLSSTAHEIGAGYQTSTVSGIRASRQARVNRLKAEADQEDDEETEDYLDRPITDRQWDRINRTLGMIQRVMGYYNEGSSELVMKYVLEKGKSKRSLVDIAMDVMKEIGVDMEEMDMKSTLSEKYTREGKVKASFKKAHQKRGK